MKTAVVYARYSCDNQTEQSIEGQLRVCNEYAQKNNIIILSTYIDRAMTGTNDNRADFQRMIKDSYKKEWDYVLVYKLDRFSRDKYGTAVHKKTLRDNGVKVISAMENIPDSPEGIILESVLEGLNQYYSMELSQKVLRGMKETRLKGLWQGGTMPYGYKEVDRRVVIDEIEAPIVQYIFEQYANGEQVKDILNSLSAKGVFHKGLPFAVNSVYAMLKNEKYTGKYTLRDEVIDNIYPPIISQELFNKARARPKRHGRRSVNVSYLLSKKIICGNCGEKYNGECGTTVTGERRYYYKCSGRKKKLSNCKQPSYRKEVLESIIFKTILCEIKKSAVMEELTNLLLKVQEDSIQANTTLQILIKEQKQNEQALENIVAAIEKGMIFETTSKRLKELETRKKELETAILFEKSKTSIRLTKKDILQYFEKGLKLEQKQLFQFFIKHVIIGENEIKIIFNSPINIGPDESRDLCFFQKNIKIKESTNSKIQISINEIKLTFSF